MTVMLPKHPRFISLEGGEGAGKSSVIKQLYAWLESQGHAVVHTREPGGTPLAERIRALSLAGGGNALETEEVVLAETELLLMFAARAQHVQHVILPALAQGAVVISDRFTDSSYAYQGAGRKLDWEWIEDLERRVVGITPALTLLLDLDVQQGLARTVSRGEGSDRIECEHDDFFYARTCRLCQAS